MIADWHHGAPVRDVGRQYRKDAAEAEIHLPSGHQA